MTYHENSSLKETFFLFSSFSILTLFIIHNHRQKNYHKIDMYTYMEKNFPKKKLLLLLMILMPDKADIDGQHKAANSRAVKRHLIFLNS